MNIISEIFGAIGSIFAAIAMWEVIDTFIHHG
jgi:hypothetical protein